MTKLENAASIRSMSASASFARATVPLAWVETQQLGEGLTSYHLRLSKHPADAPRRCLLAVERERETHDRLLAEEERKIIDRHLVTEVSLQLQQLIEQGQERTTKINKEMSRCATTLGVAMKLRLGALHGRPATGTFPWSGSFCLWTTQSGLTSSVKRSENFSTSFHQGRADSKAQPHRLPNNCSPRSTTGAGTPFPLRGIKTDAGNAFTRKRYGTGSRRRKGTHVAHHSADGRRRLDNTADSSAASHAPRFILLDEAFAGLDKPTRGRCMGLLEAFDLDLMMTSEREHGAHASVSGIAIYQLVADPDAVAATRWVWNGSQNLLAPVPDTPGIAACMKDNLANKLVTRLSRPGFGKRFVDALATEFP